MGSNPVETTMNQRQREEKEKQWWKELGELADNNDVKSFYKHYAKYLEWNNVISSHRIILHKMALEVAKL